MVDPRMVGIWDERKLRRLWQFGAFFCGSLGRFLWQFGAFFVAIWGVFVAIWGVFCGNLGRTVKKTPRKH